MPIKETVAALYYCQYVGRYWDFWLYAEEGGSGASKLVRKVV